MSNELGMFKHEITLRVRYGETDQMGYVYYGNYSQYYEVGRVEAMRAIGIPYAALEKQHGIWMPVVSMHARFLRPALYDDVLKIKTCIRSNSKYQMRFDTEIFNEASQLLNASQVILNFVDSNTKKRIEMPEFIRKKLNIYFEDQI